MDYSDLIDSATWQFIRATARHYPADAAELSIAEQRRVYDAMCRAFAAGRPDHIKVVDSRAGAVGLRHYSAGGGGASIVYFHGGGYFAGSINSHKNLISIISNNSNLIIYFFEYRLSPEHNFPAAHDDAKLAVSYIDELHKNQQSIWIGESAGGGLATGVTVDDSYNIKPDNLILLSPWLDLSDSAEDKKYLKNKDVTIIIEGMYEVGEYYAGEYGTSNPILSPIYADIKSFPDVLIQVSTDELLYNDAIEFSKKLRDKNVNVELQTWSGVWHAWQFFPIKESYEAIENIISYIKSLEVHSSK